MKAKIFEIKRFAIHDGDGVRTTVFFKGCSLRCWWCHNPEGLDFENELAFFENKCIHCGKCVNACPNNAHVLENGKHGFVRSLCNNCGKCKDVCFQNAIKVFGYDINLDDLITEVLKDKQFYDLSGGGVTLSGGECLLQANFCREFLKELKNHGINTAVDTAGYVPKEAILKVLPYVDVFLFDIKSYNLQKHVDATGKANTLVLENLELIDLNNKKIEVRIPYIPNFSQEEIEKISIILSRLKNLVGVRILPYHNFAGSKYSALGKVNTLTDERVSQQEIEIAKKKLIDKGIRVLN